MRPQATERQASGPCSCAHILTAVADLLRQALELIEGPTDYRAGVAEWHAQALAQRQRTQRPHGGER